MADKSLKSTRTVLRAAMFLVVLALLQWAPAAESPDRLPVWRILEKLLAQEAVQPLPPGAGSDLPYPPERRFLFDEILALKPDALLRGVAYVAVRNPAPAQADDATLAAHARQVDEDLQAVLEYYPLIARSNEDFLKLTALIASGKQPLALRHYLLRNCAPPTGQPGALCAYLRDHLADGAPTFQDILLGLLQNPTEDPTLRIQAAGLIEVLISDSFNGILTHSEKARAFAAQTGQPLDIRPELIAPGSIPLEKADQVRVEQQRQRAGTAAAVLEMIARDGSRDEALRQAASETATRLRESYPLPRPEDVLSPPPPIPLPEGN